MEVDKPEDIDERVIEKAIVRNIKKFIMTFGRDFACIGNFQKATIEYQAFRPKMPLKKNLLKFVGRGQSWVKDNRPPRRAFGQHTWGALFILYITI